MFGPRGREEHFNFMKLCFSPGVGAGDLGLSGSADFGAISPAFEPSRRERRDLQRRDLQKVTFVGCGVPTDKLILSLSGRMPRSQRSNSLGDEIRSRRDSWRPLCLGREAKSRLGRKFRSRSYEQTWSVLFELIWPSYLCAAAGRGTRAGALRVSLCSRVCVLSFGKLCMSDFRRLMGKDARTCVRGGLFVSVSRTSDGQRSLQQKVPRCRETLLRCRALG